VKSRYRWKLVQIICCRQANGEEISVHGLSMIGIRILCHSIELLNG
jgi:hypothetical protein